MIAFGPEEVTRLIDEGEGEAALRLLAEVDLSNSERERLRSLATREQTPTQQAPACPLDCI